MILKRLLPLFFLFCFSTAKAQFAGNALDFDGASDMVVSNTMPALFSSPGTNDFTIEAWVNPRGSVFARILFAQPGTTNFVSFGTSTGNTIYFYVIVNNTTYSVATSAGIPQNQWTHVAATWVASTHAEAIYFNGVAQATTNGGTSSTGTSGLMVLGARPGGSQYFNGALDEVRVWNETRTACEIRDNMHNSITGAQTNLAVNYNFNQGVAGGNNTGITTLPDLSTNNYNGTLTTFALNGSTSNWIASGATLATSGNPAQGVTVTQTAAVCPGGSYTFPDASTQSNITAQVMHTSNFTTTAGCDSFVVTTVNVNPSYALNETAVICSGSSYTFPDGSTQTNITAQAVHTSMFQTTAGCDSSITTTVNLLGTYALMEAATVCSGGSYTFPDASTASNITAQVVHTSMFQTTAGCDSTITTTVDVNPTYSSNETAAVCPGSSYTFPDASVQTNITAQTIHTSMLQTIAGCDSLITTTVNVNPTYAVSESALVCPGSGYVFPDATALINITAQVIHTSVLQTVAGCDSSITTTVNVNPAYSFNASDSVCSGSSYTFPDGSTTSNITATVSHTSAMQTVAGCDSMIVTTVNAIQVNTAVTQAGFTLTSSQQNATYQWINCATGNAVMNATAQSFAPTNGGTYAVAVVVNGCTDTSACFVVPVGVNELNNLSGISVYPNPVQDVLFIALDKTAAGTIEVIELSGAVVRTVQFNGTQVALDMNGLAGGMYWISVLTAEGRVMKQVIKN